MKKEKIFWIPAEVDGNNNLLIRIVDALVDCVEHTNKQPTRIFLTKVDELYLYCLGTNQVGPELVNLIMRHGTREGLRIFSNGKLGGLPVVWDADGSRVE